MKRYFFVLLNIKNKHMKERNKRNYLKKKVEEHETSFRKNKKKRKCENILERKCILNTTAFLCHI